MGQFVMEPTSLQMNKKCFANYIKLRIKIIPEFQTGLCLVIQTVLYAMVFVY